MRQSKPPATRTSQPTAPADASSVAATAEQTTIPGTDEKAAPERPRELRPVQFDAARDYIITHEAIVHRADSLDALAKKTEGEGYRRQAGEIKADAARLR